jgi:hypothetical protein
MSIKKPNNHSGWKSKLDELDCLPGEKNPYSNALWQKLDSRLQEKKRSRKALWYWAAAVLLPVLMLSLWAIRGKENELVKTLPVQDQPQKTIAAGIQVINKDTAAVTEVIKNEKKSIVTVNKETEQMIPGTAVIKETVTGTTANDTNTFVQLMPAIIPAATTDTSVTTAVAVQPVKKKLKVVHINELNEPGLPARIAFPGEDYSILQFRLINQQVYSTASPSGNNINFKIPFSKKISTN